MRTSAQRKIVTPKGERYPGSGMKKGYVNPVSVEARQLVAELVNDPAYQARLRRDFRLRKLHPTIESLVWAYFIGKPRQDVNISGSLDVNTRIDEERRVFIQLDVPELEQLALESQGMLARAKAVIEARAGTATPLDVVVGGETLGTGEELLRKVVGSDNTSSVNQPTTPTISPQL